MKIRFNFKNISGFTLIEIMVSVLVLALISSMIVALNSNSQAKSQADLLQTKIFAGTIKNKLAQNMVGAWSFYEGTGSTIHDSSDYQNNGTITGASWATSSSCIENNCLSFNGVSNGVVTFNAPVLTPSAMTVSFWWKRTGNAGGASTTYHHILRYLAGASGSNANSFYIQSAGDTAMFRLTINGGMINNYLYNLKINEWNHLVGIWDGQNIYGYVNGIKGSPTSASGVLTTGTAPLNIGRASDYVVNGLVDEVSIYSTAYTVSQVQEQYLAGLNSLLNKKQISNEEYQQRIAELQTQIVQK